MNFIFSGVLTVFCLFIIFLVNLLKKGSFVNILVNTIVGGILIFVFLSAVQFILSSVFNIDLFLAENRHKIDYDDDEEVGENVNVVAGDDSENDDSQLTGYEENNKNDNIGEDETLYDNSNSEDPTDGFSDGDFQFEETNFGNLGKIDDYEKDIESMDVGYDASGYDIKPPSNSNSREKDTVSSKLGFDASYEDLAKAVRTTLKRE